MAEIKVQSTNSSDVHYNNTIMHKLLIIAFT